MPKSPAGGFVQRCFINHPARSNLIPSKPCSHRILKTALRENMAGQWIKQLSSRTTCLNQLDYPSLPRLSQMSHCDLLWLAATVVY
jgi:hypothetical protein